MALQDVCGFHNASLYSQWNTLHCSSMSLENTIHMLGKGYGQDSAYRLWHRSSTSSPLEFYVPVLEYLAESPIEFGQIHPNSNTPWSIPEPSDHPHNSFPSLFVQSPIPLSISPSVPLPFPLGHGTTTLGFVFQGGVIAAADSRSSCSGLVACPASQKILPVHSHLVGTTSGTSADCALWKRILARELRLYQLRHRRRLSTGGAAKLLSHMLHPFKGTELCVAATLCGWDGEADASLDEGTGTEDEHITGAEKHEIAFGISSQPTRENDERTQPSVISGSSFKSTAAKSEKHDLMTLSNTRCQPAAKSDQPTGSITANSTRMASKHSGPRLYYVCSDGRRLQGELFSVGSGSPYAYSILDGRVQWGLSVDDAVSIAREAVYRATHRDAYSGNNVDLYHVTAKGWRRRQREDLKEEYYREKERERRRMEERRREKHDSSQTR